MADTAEKILDIAERLIRDRGYHGFSFQDISDEIGIRKPSLYYHFASKAELGRAVFARYRERMAVVAKAALELLPDDPWAALGRYLEPMISYGRRVEDVCLAGVAGAAIMGLPQPMQEEIAGFFREHEVWLAQLLAEGRAQSAFAYNGSPEALARLVLGALEGGLLIKCATGEMAFIDDLVGTLQAMLTPVSATS